LIDANPRKSNGRAALSHTSPEDEMGFSMAGKLERLRTGRFADLGFITISSSTSTIKKNFGRLQKLVMLPFRQLGRVETKIFLPD